jgi:hypothetical protein
VLDLVVPLSNFQFEQAVCRAMRSCTQQSGRDKVRRAGLTIVEYRARLVLAERAVIRHIDDPQPRGSVDDDPHVDDAVAVIDHDVDR